VEKAGYQALTMRRVASALETGPSSLYAHVVNKEDLCVPRISSAALTCPHKSQNRARALFTPAAAGR
jgi:hypothetical protein